ncbi:MAG: PHP domain-containing protein [Erysipelotrichaceae bacterium]|nr:PHP domain-containing protein [Erysipelotrichaceae bacterium]
MTPNNIVNMALIKGLDMIAICDHNSNLQLPAMAQLADKIKILYGVEIETQEEVHILALFKKLKDNQAFITVLDKYKLHTPNDPQFFGNQLIMDEKDQIVDQHADLLLTSTFLSIDDWIAHIHQHHGIAILAHVMDRKNSITNQLGFIPENILCDAIEVKDKKEMALVKALYPAYAQHLFLINSDAHRLVDISERKYAFDIQTFQKLWKY